VAQSLAIAYFKKLSFSAVLSIDKNNVTIWTFGLNLYLCPQSDVIIMKRKYCRYCKARREAVYMTLFFKHPVICPGGIYTCNDSRCMDAVSKEIQLNKAIGKFSLIVNI